MKYLFYKMDRIEKFGCQALIVFISVAIFMITIGNPIGTLFVAPWAYAQGWNVGVFVTQFWFFGPYFILFVGIAIQWLRVLNAEKREQFLKDQESNT